jgi:hypothetical protein
MPWNLEGGREYAPDQIYRDLQAGANETELLQEQADQDRANFLTYFPFKAGMIRFTGSANGDPVLVGNPFNADVAKGAGTGIYRVTLSQPTIYGQQVIGDQFFPVVTLGMDSTLDTYQWSFTDGDGAGGWFEITVYLLETDGAGSNTNIIRVPEDMAANDDMWVIGMLNIISPDSKPIPLTASTRRDF